ncbi:MAG: Calx-beta domain-containing protein, partial [Akkermansiaceae bacterium]
GTATLADGTSFVVHAPFQQPTVIKKFLPNGLEDNSYVSPAITNGGNNGNVFSISAAADGKLYLRGIFDSVGGVARPSVARLNADGTLDTGFAPTFGGTHSIGGDTIYATNNGLYLVLKPFGQAGGLARLTDTGAIDSTFKFGNASVQNTFLSVRALQEQADGSILVGYLYGLGASVSSWGFTKLEADGDVDTTFNSITNSGAGLTHYPTGIARRPDGAIFYSTSRQIGLANADGSLNSSFTQPGAFNGNINSIVVIKGKLIAGGAFTDIGGTSAGYIARFLNNGTVDSTFPGGSGADSTINYLRPTNDLKLMVGGNFATFNTGSYPALVKLLMSDPAVEILTPNPVFETDGTVTITLRRSGKTDTAISVDVATMSDSATENVDFSAHSSTVSWGAGDTADKTITVTLLDDSDDEGTEMFSVNLSNPTGTSLLNESTSVTIRDDEAVPNITAQPVAAAVLDNGSATFSVTATSGFALSYQWYFNGNAISGATSDSLTINPATAAEEGNYHVVVSTPDESVTSDSVSLTIVPDPTAVSSLHTSPASAAASGNISVVVAAPDGGAYIGGSFLDFGGNTALDYIAKIKEDGSIDSSFTPPALNNQVYDIALAPNGDVYIAGQFTGTVIKLSPTGTEDTTFSTNRGSGGNNRANTVGVFPDGTIAVAGDFRTWNGTTIAASNQQNSHVVRLNPDGTLTNTRYPNPGHSSHYLLNVDAMQVFDDGRIMVAYDQTSSAYAKARLYNTDGSEVTSFVYPFNSRRVDDIAQFSDGSFLFSGDNSLYHVSATGSVTATYDTSSDWFSSVIQIDG